MVLLNLALFLDSAGLLWQSLDIQVNIEPDDPAPVRVSGYNLALSVLHIALEKVE